VEKTTGARIVLQRCFTLKVSEISISISISERGISLLAGFDVCSGTNKLVTGSSL
jgi:hypothetical protein